MHRVAAIALVVLTAALTVRGAGSPAQGSPPLIIPADGAPPGPRTGLIVGQVVDEAGSPVPEAIVQMSMPKYFSELPTTPKGRVMADAEGRFFFSDLPAGDYYLSAKMEGYSGGTYGLRRVTGDSQLFNLGEGERRVDARLTLWKYAVIGGTVVDEAGEPVIGVSVQALPRRIMAGRPAYGAPELAYLNAGSSTDDRGMFRLSKLLPGSYLVVVPSTLTTMPVELLATSNANTALRNELAGAIAEISPLGQPRTQQFGDYALLTLNRVLIPPASSPAGRMEVYKTTYFPAATTASAASTITVAAGEERTDLKIGLRPAPAVRISGRLVTPDGTPPPPTSLRLVGEAAVGVAEEGFETVTGMSEASGRFTLLGVPAGEYVLKQASRLALFGLQGRQAWWMAQPVTVGTSDIPNLVVTLRPALRLEGRVEFRGTTAPPPPVPNILTFGAVGFLTPFGEAGTASGQGRGDQSFSTIAAAGRYVVQPLEIGGWFVKSVTLDGKDITDRVFDLQSDATSFVVVYTDRTSKVTGVVKDARGAASVTAVVLAFPVDPERWAGYGARPRNLKSALVSRTGAYTLEGLPAGDYYLVAIDDAQSDGWTDPKTLDSLARQATKLTVMDVEQKTVDLTVKSIR
jgi:hypothetical protein